MASTSASPATGSELPSYIDDDELLALGLTLSQYDNIDPETAVHLASSHLFPPPPFSDDLPPGLASSDRGIVDVELEAARTQDQLDTDEQLARALSLGADPEIDGSVEYALRLMEEPRWSPAGQASRDRYHSANVATYRTDPRRRQSRGQDESSSSAAQYPLHTMHTPGSWEHTDEPSKPGRRRRMRWHRFWNSDRTSASSSTSKGKEPESSVLPIKDRSQGSPMINILSPDALRSITDHLWFPDAFAIALTCKSVHAVLNLRTKKHEYFRELVQDSEARRQVFMFMKPADPKRFCGVCLYLLPVSYFEYGGCASNKVCADCGEARTAGALDKMTPAEEEAAFAAGKLVARNAAPIWRPSVRVHCAGYNGLWYRERT